MTDDEVMTHLRDQTPFNHVRAVFHSETARLEQAFQQRKTPGPVETRKMEFAAVERILRIALEHGVIRDSMQMIFDVSDQVANDRSLRDIFAHGEEEIAELREELDKFDVGAEPGEDGITGEAIDVILCMVDLIRRHDPTLTVDQLQQRMTVKMNKWLTKIGH